MALASLVMLLSHHFQQTENPLVPTMDTHTPERHTSPPFKPKALEEEELRTTIDVTYFPFRAQDCHVKRHGIGSNFIDFHNY